jgi:hypothetical protein
MRYLAPTLGVPQHPDQHRPERPILLAVDQELGEGAALRIPPELADPVGSLEVREHQDVEQLGAGLPSGRPANPGPYACFLALSENIRGSSPVMLGGIHHLPSSRRSSIAIILESHHGNSRTTSIRRPASARADTISPRP